MTESLICYFANVQILASQYALTSLDPPILFDQLSRLQ
jgi:hypothetical protein